MQIPKHHWYPALTTDELGRKPLGVERLGEKLVFWRGQNQTVHALADRCPHLGAALSLGRIVDNCIACPFHGFRFGKDGQCTHAPALGREARIPEALSARAFPVIERHGFIWLWWGDNLPGDHTPAFFSELESGWSHGTVTADWPVHYTRAIENQLDVAHLPFVHRTTIGASGAARVDGPHVEADADSIRVWVTNRLDDGMPARSAAQLAAAASATNPGLHFRFPGVWLLNISKHFKNFLAFVPVNEHSTRFYLRSYLRIRNPLVAVPAHWLLAQSNRFILNQDRRVVMTQPNGSTLESRSDHLVSTDQAIIAFRRQLALQLTARQAS